MSLICSPRPGSPNMLQMHDLEHAVLQMPLDREARQKVVVGADAQLKQATAVPDARWSKRMSRTAAIDGA